ncbi:MAG: alcohol dehydrogenase [Bdellovibrio sp. CG10_big_fil_rev_8_21_14_0_10_47_8]|nr:MAG: alcohol dehydrogenase [Bdellovibrio sp. CG10_big_fil_rev_8_21_14_0_10_47_8]
MARWKEALVSRQTSIREAIQILDKSALQIVLVVDENQRLLGTITDGDVRRGILRGLELSQSVQEVMNPNPTVIRSEDDRETILATMRSRGIHHMPLVDDDGRLVGLDTLDELLQPQRKDNPVVLMAGGLGTRLRPLTADCPKPMIHVGNKPLLETIIENFLSYGFHRFYISVNYKADVVKSYFEDGSKWGANIQYLHETHSLGTAGALSLLPETPELPMLVMNGDVLTKVNFAQLLNFHSKKQAMGTMCVREYDFQVPYGVVEIDKHRMLGITEKPIQRFFVNAGIYVLDPAALQFVAQNTFFDMPTLFEKLMEKKKETIVFPVREYWLDIGQMSDYDRANGEYKEFFP